ncbi:hypothetical protein Q0812_06545 [Brevundimonas sp. 2R-24]|uniref:Secreted protein n=1 Tax=Peiella sedimenti TaxID=3061083 RepID=A0ABT8SLR0_9CAUL|nr:hypothetical protein [Caulobacteraceae bacterium XZ-24]
MTTRTAMIVVALGAGLAFTGVALDAHAQSRTSPAGVQAPPQTFNLTEGQSQRRSLQWDRNGRWGLNLETRQPVGREADWSDVDAGAYFRLSPSLRVGGSVGLGERRPDPARPAPEARTQPRVRLETTFKF